MDPSHDHNANLIDRLSRILFDVVVRPSAERKLLGDLDKLIVGGDGSTLHTGAQGRGKKTCEHHRFERCDCDRLYADPDTRMRWDRTVPHPSNRGYTAADLTPRRYKATLAAES